MLVEPPVWACFDILERIELVADAALVVHEANSEGVLRQGFGRGPPRDCLNA